MADPLNRYRKVTIDPWWKQILEMRPARLVMMYRRLTPAERAAGREAAGRDRERREAEAAAKSLERRRQQQQQR